MRWYDGTMLEHFLIAMLMSVIGLTIGAWYPLITYTGASAAIAGFIFREVTQAEYRWIEKYGGGLRENMPWYAGFLPCVWDLHSVLDVVAPILAVCFTGFLFWMYF